MLHHEYSILEYLEYQTELNALARPLPNTLNGNWANLGWTGDCNLLVAISEGGCDDCSMQEVDCSWVTCRDLPSGAITVLSCLNSWCSGCSYILIMI